MCINTTPLVGSIAFTLFGIYIFIKSHMRDSDFIPKDDGGTPSCFFYLFCAQIYHLIKNEKKYEKNFPDNYFTLLKCFGLFFIASGSFLIFISLLAC